MRSIDSARRERDLTPLTGRRASVYSFADQAVSSGSNFALGVLVARVSGADGLGSFGIAFLVWLAAFGLNRAFVCEPMTVCGSTTGDGDWSEGASASLALGLLIALPLAVATGVILSRGFGSAGSVAALAPWLPSLLVQDYYRSMSFRRRRPDHALVSDVVFVLVQAAVSAAVVLLGAAGVATILGGWGVGATAGALTGLALSRLRLNPWRGAIYLAWLWSRSRWFLADFATSFVFGQGYLLMLPIMLGLAQFGQYRAGMSLLGPVTALIFTAGSNVGLPGCVRQLRDEGVGGLGRYSARLTLVVAGLTVPFCLTVAILAPTLLRLVYGEQFVAGAVITRLSGIGLCLFALGYGGQVALKSANQMRWLWTLRTVNGAFGMIAALVLVATVGLAGVGWASLVGNALYTVGIVFGYRRMRALPARPAPLPVGPQRTSTP
jgi:O-antigen/teichoic acid export membrane protein